MTEKKEVICYGQTNNGDMCQESYCTLSRQARTRAKQLRDAGYRVISSSMGLQVTRVGSVKLTMLTILPGNNDDTYDLPYVKIERI